MEFKKQLAALTFSLLAVVAIGCGGGDYVPVAGTVTFDGGPPPHPGRLSFVSISKSEEYPSRDGTAMFTTEGTFEAVTAKDAGLLPGKYRVEVTCNKHEPDYSVAQRGLDPFAEASVVDPSYEPQEITVEKGKPLRDLTIDVPLKK